MSLGDSATQPPRALADAIPSGEKLVILTIDFGTSNTAQQYVILEPDEIEDRTKDDAETQEIRDELRPIIERLQDSRRIPQGAPHVTITADFFTRLLSHTKFQLKRLHGLEKDYKIEVVLCVPVVFRLDACMDLQKALAKALCRVNLGGSDLSDKWIPRFSMITEPEAGAEWALKQYPAIDTGDSLPLRLGREDAPPTGDLCGSNILNGMFYKLTLHRLKEGAPYLEGLHGRVCRKLPKKSPRTSSSIEREAMIYKNHDFGKGILRVANDAVAMMFTTCLDKVWALTKTQLDKARERGRPVDYIIILGGFSRSVSYQVYLKRCLATYNTLHKTEIKLLGEGLPIDPAAIAKGAALRALNRSSEPARALPSSYGILRHIEDCEWSEDYHLLPAKTLRGRSRYTYLDGRWWFFDRIIWFAQKGEEVGKDWTCSIKCEHVFAHHEPKLLAEEQIIISDTTMETGYGKESRKNRGSRCIGKLVADMTSLRDEGVILPEHSENGKTLCWRIEIQLIIRIKGLNLEAEARYKGEKKGECVINMAPALVSSSG
ncbi:hypothetical protein PG994_004392 [Apiospora phragmitis]|uniref:Actin-like ATPase domain-containing protein n=1 Tax=Apiospora phragmitis TaxID=2905665 RepID=A0ABR1VQK5_9PEZI